MTYIFLHFTSVCFVWKSFSTFFTRIRKRFLEFILSVHELLLYNNWNKVLSYKQPQQQQLLLPTVNMIVVSALDELNFGLLQFGEIVGKKFISIEFFGNNGNGHNILVKWWGMMTPSAVWNWVVLVQHHSSHNFNKWDK